MDHRKYYHWQSIGATWNEFPTSTVHHFMVNLGSKEFGALPRKTPNPTKVVLTSQSLICKYNEAFQKNQLQPEVGTRLKHSQTLDHQNWQAIIKVATYRNRRSKRCRYAFEAITMDGINLFIEGASSGRQSQHLANQEAVVEAIIKANEIDLSRIIIMCNCRKNIANLQQLQSASMAGTNLCL